MNGPVRPTRPCSTVRRGPPSTGIGSRIRIDHAIILQDFRDYEPADQKLRQARGVLEVLVREAPGELTFQQHLAEAHHNLGILYDAMNRRQEALGFFAQGLALRESLVRQSATRSLRRDLAQPRLHRRCGTGPGHARQSLGVVPSGRVHSQATGDRRASGHRSSFPTGGAASATRGTSTTARGISIRRLPNTKKRVCGAKNWFANGPR